MFFTVEYQLLIYLIGQDIQIVPDCDVSQFFQCFPAQYPAGWIVGGDNDNHFRPLRDFAFQFLHINLIVILLLQGIGNCLGAKVFRHMDVI